MGVGFLLYYAAMDVAASPIYAQAATDPSAASAVHCVWYMAMGGFLVLLAAGFRTLAAPLWLLLAASDGTEDLLFYLLQGKLPPQSLGWLDGDPVDFPKPVTVESLLFGLCLSVVALPVLLRLERSVRNTLRVARTS